MVKAQLLKQADISRLESILLDDTGQVQPVSFDRIKDVPQEHLSLFAIKHAVYVFPTTELIDWLRTRIAGCHAIEVGSGKAGIGRALDIRCTDSCLQEQPEIAAHCRLLRQTPIVYPDYIEKIDAEAAVATYQPAVVVGCFITQFYQPGDGQASIYGPREELFVQQADYIHVGNFGSHGEKRILNLTHEEFQFPWLVTRSMSRSDNFIAHWKQGAV